MVVRSPVEVTTIKVIFLQINHIKVLILLIMPCLMSLTWNLKYKIFQAIDAYGCILLCRIPVPSLSKLMIKKPENCQTRCYIKTIFRFIIICTICYYCIGLMDFSLCIQYVLST